MYSILCFDKPDHLHLRLETRPAHIEYAMTAGKIAMGGPFLADDGETMIGSLIILDVVTREEAEAWAANDPYAKAGLFERTEIKAFKHLIGGLADPNQS